MSCDPLSHAQRNAVVAVGHEIDLADFVDLKEDKFLGRIQRGVDASPALNQPRLRGGESRVKSL